MDERVSLDEVDGVVAALADADTPSEVLSRLLDGSRLGAPRASLFLLHGGNLKGWGCSGYPADVTSRLAATSVPATQSWLLRLVENPGARSDRLRPEDPPAFGQSRAGEVVAVPVRVGERPVALLIAERGEREGPWVPALLGILASVARSRLALDLARRRLALAAAQVAELSEAPAQVAAELSELPAQIAAEVSAEPAQVTAEVSELPQAVETPQVGSEPVPAAEEPEATELTPVEQPEEIGLPGGPVKPRHEAEKRYARLIATDIRLYNEEDVMLGRRHGDLAKRLTDQLNRGREAFARRYPHLGADGLEILHEAYVQVLAAGDAELIGAPNDP